MIAFLQQPWHWSVAGILIGLIVPALLILGNKKFGISSSFRHLCAMCVPAKVPYFHYNWRKEIWNLYFVAGIILGSFLTVLFLQNPEDTQIAEATKGMLTQQYHISDYTGLMPSEIFSWQNVFTLKGFFFFILGGFMVGFGTRYAGGCTSGHSIMGLSNLQVSSLIATICFMVGGFISTNLLLPLIFKLF